MEKTLNQDLVLDTPLDLGAAQDDDLESEASRRERVMHCYRHPGGPLLGWLADEAKRRGHTGQAMAECLGVTAGYIHQLRTGHRHLCNISDLFARSCARYLGVPPIVVKLLAGRIAVSDFLNPEVSEAELIERGFRSMLGDSSVRELMPIDLEVLTPEARRALVMLYAEVTHADIFGARELPNLLRYLQQAAVVHDENLESADQRLHLAA